ncbi:MAG: RidA family protein [Actinomycetota bacterium]|jgi:enamine deaminase RidA (YjgF/YER057c/UK114 family)|nr:RidA family protein [Actinomycetota bacterium]
MRRRLISSGSEYEARYGYSRAVVVGDRVWVAGCAPLMPGGDAPPPDAYDQTVRCLDIAEAALREAGGDIADVVRSRVYVVHRSDMPEVGRALGERFAAVRPANTTVVAELLDPAWLVEVELEAVLGSG